MKNAINKQFEMVPGSKEVDTVGTFKNDAAVLNMGHPSNYGMSDSPANMGHATTPANSGHESDKKKKKTSPTDGMSVEEKLAYYKRQKENTKAKKQSRVKMGIGTGFTSL